MRHCARTWMVVAFMAGAAAASACDGQATDPPNDVPPEATTHQARVTGTVHGQGGQPLAGLTVTLRPVTPGSTRGPGSVGAMGHSATTDSQGGFSLDVGVIPGDQYRGGQGVFPVVVLAFAQARPFPRRSDGPPYADSARVEVRVVPHGAPPPEHAGVYLVLPLAPQAP